MRGVRKGWLPRQAHTQSFPGARKTQAQRDIYFPEVSLTNLVNGRHSSFQGCAWPPPHQLRRVTCDLSLQEPGLQSLAHSDWRQTL